MISSGNERAQGYAVETSPEGMKECDTYTCGHCQRIVFVPSGHSASTIQTRAPTRMEDKGGTTGGGLCKMCMTLICPRCVDNGFCLPFMKKLEAEEGLDRTLRSYELPHTRID